ncbi:unnamed protein product [Ectocarpus sp. 6 AP-2014]
MFCSQRFMVVVGLLAALLVFAGVTLQSSWNVERSLSFTSVDRSVASHRTPSGSSAFGDGKKEIGEVNSSSQHRGLFDQGARDGRGERRARLAFLIMSSGDDIAKLSVLLPEIYHPDNIYLVHVDAKAPREQTEKIREVVRANFPAADGRPPNGRLLEPAGIVSWGGFSITLACLYGIAAALLWDEGWDYFINLSTSDFPVVTQDEMSLFLGEHADAGVSFMDGELMTGFEKRWQGYTEDQGLQRRADHHTSVAMQTLGRIQRAYPQRFRLYKGEFWGAFHRSFCEYASWSPDNVARTLSAYFTGYRISDESYFQTLACHPEGKVFPIHGDNFRFTSWNEHHRDSHGRKIDANGHILIHPEPLAIASVDKIMASSSGALFARKFDYAKSYRVYQAMQDDLRNRDRSAARLDRARARFGLRASDKGGRDDFCRGGYKAFRRRTEEQRNEGGGGVGTAVPR